MKVVYNHHGTRHIVDETIVEGTSEEWDEDEGRMVEKTRGNYVALCGRTVYGVSDDEWWFDDFPEDFGDVPKDCGNCARAFDV